MIRIAQIAALVAIGLVGCAPEASPEEAEPALQPGDRAPDFALPSASEAPVALSDFRDRPTLLYFSMGPG